MIDPRPAQAAPSCSSAAPAFSPLAPAQPLAHPPADTFADTPLLAGLNPEQRAAVTFRGGNALILAGAGSGKTRVLTTRIAWLLQTGQASPGGILAVTFTNKAAREMVARLSALVPISVRGMWIGTFHGLCNRMLRAHAQTVGLPRQFQILDMQDQLAAIKRLLKANHIDAELLPPKKLQIFINACKEDGLRASEAPARDADARQKVQLYHLYEQQCQREGVVDFGELMLRSYELLRDNAAIRQHYQQRFAHILIDEFQDTNRLQYQWLKLISGAARAPFAADAADAGASSVVAVGDDDQSIYAFRGARVGNMADFVREFRVAQPIKLEQNYRSYSHILDSANALIAHNRQRLGKNLRTEQGAGEPLRVHEAVNDGSEAQWVVDEVRQLMQIEGFAQREIAMLYRSNAQSRALESALLAAKVPYRIYGGLRFFERAEIKHALAYLRLLENLGDDTSFLRVVNFPTRGIGARTLEALQEVAQARQLPLAQAVAHLEGKTAAKLQAFVRLIEQLRSACQGQPLRGVIAQVLEHSGLLEHYRLEKDGQERLENLDELLNAADAFILQEGFARDATALPLDEHGQPLPESWLPQPLTQSPASQGLAVDGDALPDAPLHAPLPSEGGAAPRWEQMDALDASASTFYDPDTGETLSPLGAFLTHAALEAGDNQAQAGQDAVQLMTVHASKGLEFDAVFIVGLEEGLFPHYNSLADQEGLEEERRLMYVAITRARKRLYLSLAMERMLNGQAQYNPPSRFLDELPPESVRWLTPRRPKAGAGSGAGYGGAGRYGAGARAPWQGRQAAASAKPATAPSAAPPARYASSNAIARAASSSAAPSNPWGIRSGQTVFHAKFGQGQVLAVEGQGAEAKARVDFGRHGSKLLLLSVAKLTVVP
ncbi:DNA helicase II [Allofranklinella schreckenbergeri]|uniref:DNA 3'-5' helicase n=1 Tax=Allofranklinella schreckenbergeri TaxID=1076744 RepID=A0A3M6Q700_9BURK|nr:UvrD-helicase domain-containing protein [Allofranklinella schreckenbergeri]RMW98942.1 DNA helicase II [Allofranklinella schreckenbergeri]